MFHSVSFWFQVPRTQTHEEALCLFGFKLVDLCQTMILGSMEDERIFSAMSFLKSKWRNKIDKNVDTFLRLYVIKYEVDNFPYE